MAHAGARHLDRGARLAERRDRLIGFLLADRAPVGERLQALGLLAGELLPRDLLRERAARLSELDLEGRPLDLEEHGAGFHAVAFRVELVLEDAGNPRAHLHLARAFGAAHRLEAHRHVARRHLDHAHRHGLRRGLGVVLLLLGVALAARRDQHTDGNGKNSHGA